MRPLEPPLIALDSNLNPTTVLKDKHKLWAVLDARLSVLSPIKRQQILSARHVRIIEYACGHVTKHSAPVLKEEVAQHLVDVTGEHCAQCQKGTQK